MRGLVDLALHNPAVFSSITNSQRDAAVQQPSGRDVGHEQAAVLGQQDLDLLGENFRSILGDAGGVVVEGCPAMGVDEAGV